MKVTVTELSKVSKMKYDLQSKSLMTKLIKLESKVREKFKIKENAKLKDIEAYNSQCNFIFTNHEIVFHC